MTYANSMSSTDTTITFIGTVERVTTITDGGLRCSFNMPEDAIAQSALLMECKRMELVLKITCEVQTPVQPRKAQRKSKRLPAKQVDSGYGE